MRFQYKSDKVINDKAPEIKEINDKKLIDISYKLINNNNDIENNIMSDVDEEDSNLSNSEENEEN